MISPYLSTDFLLVIPVYRHLDTDLYTLYRRSSLPGILAKQRPRVLIVEQIEKLLAEHLQLKAGQFSISDNFWLENSLKTGTAAILVELHTLPERAEAFVTFPEALRQMAKGRARLIFLKAWQLLSDNAEIKVIEG